MTNRFASVALVAATLAADPLAAAERAGRATAVQPDALQATGPIGHPVETNDDIFTKARVYTKQYGTLEITLTDGGKLTVAPNAALVIDDYVFAGEGSPGSLAVSVSRGAMRLISGRMPSADVQIATPIAAIGVRGTTIWVSVVNDDRTEVWVTDGAGAVTLSANGQAYELAAPAHAICSPESCVMDDEPPAPVLFPVGGGASGEGPGGSSGGGQSDGGR